MWQLWRQMNETEIAVLSVQCYCSNSRHIYLQIGKIKCKAIPLRVWTGPWGRGG
jgi:hypothetical protein